MVFKTSDPIIKRLGAAAVTYDLSRLHETTITLPVGTTWSSGLHWHETHDETLRVIRGSIRVRLGEEVFILDAGQEARVHKFVRHEWSRAQMSEGEDVIVIETTEPRDEEKQLFFWNLNGIILTAAGRGIIADLFLTVRLFVIFQHLDNWPILLDLSSCRPYLNETMAFTIESFVTHCVLSFVALFASVFGYHAVNEQFTPSYLLESWKNRESVKIK
ncbi:uncharacterized protein PV09_03858 [Verruconis gallopava]|uniref:Cupin type-2 domain-containing protein n=1 Tax=Verruconis gallopava TaxID=253628 RepID=A0A0D2B1Z7_9PEZI|nr:uncharacterized protein PV09_03858 [Verruconis gallopava]KIW05339.1 hypothetical protein PV09_03858 [Verruconis gallopava]